MRHYVNRIDIGYGLFDLKCRDCDFEMRKVESGFTHEIANQHRVDALEVLVEGLVEDNADLLAKLDASAFAVRQGLEDVARQQREAIADSFGSGGRCECDADTLCEYCVTARWADHIRSLPLVTDTK